ncbi:MAG: DM13 domain-containing protein [bacterium]|nr:DM13 domain-containing protein [bacterium]
MSTRLRFFVILLGALLVAATYSFPLWQPFLLRGEGEEGFPGLVENLQEAYLALPAATRRLYLQMNNQNPLMAQAVLTAALSPDEAPPEEAQALPPEAETARVVRSGEFITLDLTELDVEEEDIPPYRDLFRAEGEFNIYELADGRRLLRLENLRVTNGPNLHVYLSPNPAPLTFADLGFYYDVGQLQGNVGNQNYEIPASLNLAEYQSIVIVELSYQFIYGVAVQQ